LTLLKEPLYFGKQSIGALKHQLTPLIRCYLVLTEFVEHSKETTRLSGNLVLVHKVASTHTAKPTFYCKAPLSRMAKPRTWLRQHTATVRHRLPASMAKAQRIPA
jgi:hypothetical protein